MNPRSTDCEADALTTTLSRRSKLKEREHSLGLAAGEKRGHLEKFGGDQIQSIAHLFRAGTALN